MENLFYVLRSKDPDKIHTAEDALNSLINHYASITILASQAYQIDENGAVWGYVDPLIDAFSKEHHIKIMALVTNAKFDKIQTHAFLSNANAQKIAIHSLLAACKEHHYNGIQFDFEMVPAVDRDLLTHFFEDAAKALHAEGVMVSFAVAPTLSDNPPGSDFLKALYANWEGAYDLKALGASGDFVTVMAYNQHAGGTTPGSIATLPWVEASIQYALRFVPAQKISLGIPAYSAYWYTGKNPVSGKIEMLMSGLSFKQVRYLLGKYHANLKWDDENKINYAVYSENWLNEYIFVEDAASFKAKKELVGKYHLRGISVFDIGEEDPGIWEGLK